MGTVRPPYLWPASKRANLSVSGPPSYRRLAHVFTVRCDSPEIERYVSGVLSRFAVRDLVDGGTTYEVLDFGPSESRSRYRLLIQGEWMLGSDNAADVLDDLFSHVNLDTFEATGDRVLVHAGAVATQGDIGVVFPAPSGSGKTTLVAALVRAGFGYLSDEAAVLDPETGTLEPYPVHLSLKGVSRDRFPGVRPDAGDMALSGDTWHVDPEAIRPGAVASPCEVGFVMAHRFEPGIDLRIEALTPAEACVELARNLMLARRDGGRYLDLLARACHASHSYRLIYGDLDAAAEAIVGLTGG